MYSIVFNADEHYIQYASVLMTNIIDMVHPTADFSKEPLYFHLLTNALKQETKDNLKALQTTLSAIYPCEILLHFIDERVFKALPALNGNHSAYYRILIAEYLPQEVESCLYLDVDVLVLCDVREILNVQWNFILAAVPDFGRYANRILKPISKHYPPIAFNKSYFNSGFLLINLKQWRAQNIQAQCFKILENYHLRFHDQDILNAVFRENYHKLSFAYDFIVQAFGASVCSDESKKHYNIHHTREAFNAIKEDIKVLHYCGEKPWSTLTSYVYQGKFITDLWWEFAQKTPNFGLSKQALQHNTKAHALGFLILDAKGLRILKLPYAILQSLQADSTIPIPNILHNPFANIAYELGKLALRLVTSNKKLKYFILLFRILRLKRRLLRLK